jgi:hypothetical protein
MERSFQNISGNRFDRNFGGTKVGTADPYITGYQFVKFVDLPTTLPGAMKATANLPGLGDTKIVAKTLEASCQSVTPPGGTLNKTEFPGLGGTKWGAPTSIDYGNTMTVKFLEYSSLPILSIFHGWTRMIRDYRTGASSLIGTSYSKQQYSCSMFFWTTKPDGLTVEYYALMVGMFPTKDPQDLYAGDIATIDKLEVDVEFHVDRVWHEDWVYTKCKSLASRYRSEGVNYHGQLTMGNDTNGLVHDDPAI